MVFQFMFFHFILQSVAIASASFADIPGRVASVEALVKAQPECAVVELTKMRLEIEEARERLNRLEGQLEVLEKKAKDAIQANSAFLIFEKYLDSELAQVAEYVAHVMAFSEKDDDILVMLDCTLLAISKHQDLPPAIEAKRLSLMLIINMSVSEIKDRVSTVLTEEVRYREIQDMATYFLSLPSIVRYESDLRTLIKRSTHMRLQQYIEALIDIVSNGKLVSLLQSNSYTLFNIDKKLTAVERVFRKFDSDSISILEATALGNMVVWHAHLKRVIKEGHLEFSTRLERLQALFKSSGLRALFIQRQILRLPISTADAPITAERFAVLERGMNACDGFEAYFMNMRLGELFASWSALLGQSCEFPVGSKRMWDVLEAKMSKLEIGWSKGVVPDVSALMTAPVVTMEALVSRKVEKSRLALGRL